MNSQANERVPNARSQRKCSAMELIGIATTSIIMLQFVSFVCRLIVPILIVFVLLYLGFLFMSTMISTSMSRLISTRFFNSSRTRRVTGHYERIQEFLKALFETGKKVFQMWGHRVVLGKKTLDTFLIKLNLIFCCEWGDKMEIPMYSFVLQLTLFSAHSSFRHLLF